MNTMIRRVLPLVLALATLTLCLASCGGTSDKGFTFKAPAGVEIAIGDSADVVEKLGTPLSKNESASCGGIPGNDCVYTYAGYRVKTTPSNNGDVVCQIELTDDSVKTPEGVYIGMSAEDAKATMGGKGTPETVGENLIYKSAGMKLQIMVRGGTVAGITYLEA